ncbi:DEAD/DEAH box helicase [Rothia santali]|nr:DEAD/DEAH box helicase [Rothia santali]
MPYPAAQIPVSIAQVLKVAGHNTFARGERYYRAGKVLGAEYDEENLTLSAKVAGNAVRPYSQSVVFPAERVPHSAPFHSFCSCPVGTNCKHVMAALIGWFHEGGWGEGGEDRPLRSATPNGGNGRPGAAASGAQPAPGPEQDADAARRRTIDELRESVPGLTRLPAEAARAGNTTAVQGSWRRHLARALQSQTMDFRTSAQQIPVALDLRIEVPARYGLGMGSPETPAPARLSARPLLLGARGRWIKGGLTWDAFSRRAGRRTDLRPEQEDWLREFYAVVSADQNAYASTHDWLVLDYVSSPLVWDLLERSADAGVTLVIEGRQAAVSMAPEARLGLRLTDAGDGGLTLTPALSFPSDAADRGHEAAEPDDVAGRDRDTDRGRDAAGPDGVGGGPGGLWLPADRAFPIGSAQHPQAYFALGNALQREYEQKAEASGNWARTRPSPLPELNRDAEDEPWLDDRTELLFVPLLGRASPLVLSLIGSGAMDVPAAEVPDFAEGFYPQLARRAEIAADDAAAESLPEVLQPRLVFHVNFREGDPEGQEVFPAVSEWHWEYPSAPIRWPGAEAPEAVRVPVHVGHPDPHRELRDPEHEHEVLQTVRQAFPDTSLGRRRVSGWETRDLVERVLPAARGLPGVDVVVEGEVPQFRSLDEAPEITVSVESTGDRDWFGLGVTIKAGNWYVPFADIFRAVDSGQKHLLLGDGSYFRLDRPEFATLRDLIAEARQISDSSKELRISRHQAGLWEDLEELATDVETAGRWQETVGALLALEEVPTPPLPRNLTAELRPYQLEGYRWLSFLLDHGLGGILADDMGLGKTLQTIAVMARAFERHEEGAAGEGGTSPAAGERSGASEGGPDGSGEPGPGARPRFLVVAPTSVVPNWAREIERFAAHLSVAVLDTSTAKSGRSVGERIEGADVVVTSYALFRLDEHGYRETEFTGLILDEAQFLKNPRTKAHRIARDLRAGFKVAVTGTPMENDLMELWAMFSIVAPGLFPSARTFRDAYAKPIASGEDPKALPRLRQRIKPLMLRRTKELVAADLPEKQEHRIELALTDEHRRIYDTRLQRERQKILGLLQDMDQNRFTIFQSLTMLRRLSLAAGLVDAEHGHVASAKVEYLREQLPEIIADGHRALIFSQFTTFLRQIGDALDADGLPYVYLDGSTRDRAKVLRAFEDGEAPLFLISLKAGGFGLNLTAADYCFLMDPWWNPAVEEQAVDRAHRIGQRRNVMVYRLVSAGTIEEKVMELKDSKSALFDAVLDDGSVFSSGLAAEDIRGLLEG